MYKYRGEKRYICAVYYFVYIKLAVRDNQTQSPIFGQVDLHANTKTLWY